MKTLYNPFLSCPIWVLSGNPAAPFELLCKYFGEDTMINLLLA
ncbi:hypothetical protein C1G86_0466 [Dehalococcoides mccartyi]|uniref:Uncharacterized protein n=1 Tax=Dehalococcoides mccartyi TaxID=61435 RepID=A0A328ELG3_9CHLR|nr:hypothetical protein [Dehalococcoides mccartyi]RAL69495.1 hypothetical protein C1G87_0479 [Dehalococcoides mccartyi]RAL70808.1 hypothetical protein C1G86_0466 [Dehalococcoides mccartyi]